MIELDINIGDTILVGKFKNKKIVVKDIGVDDHGLPTVNGKCILKVRIPKLTESIIKEELTRDDFKDISELIRFEIARVFFDLYKKRSAWIR